MKTLLVLFLIMSYYTIFAQSPQSQPLEIYFGSVTSPITMTLTAQTTIWKSNSNHVFEKVNASLHPDYYSSSVTPPDNNVTGTLGWDFTILNNYNIPDPHFGWGIYTVTNSLNDKYFYLNYLDDEAGFYDPLTIDKCTMAHWIDVWIKYDQSSFWYENNGSNPPLGTCQWNQIQNGQILNIWSMKYNTRTPTTTRFPDYWTHCVAATKNINSNPTIIWGPYSHQDYPFTPNGYRVYRKYDQYNPNFVQIGQDLSVNTFTFTDNSITYANPHMTQGMPIEYYVVAINGSQESIHSNIADVYINGNYPMKLKPLNISNNNIEDFNLSQCYPNPFNPTTQISFSISQPSNTQLKVYDIYGREIKTLVNEFLSEGNHSYEFSGKNLASGVYFYTLKAGGYSATKKMILTK
jgi:hypothetical protein